MAKKRNAFPSPSIADSEGDASAEYAGRPHSGFVERPYIPLCSYCGSQLKNYPKKCSGCGAPPWKQNDKQ